MCSVAAEGAPVARPGQLGTLVSELRATEGSEQFARCIQQDHSNRSLIETFTKVARIYLTVHFSQHRASSR
jgi:hypothetical protein